MAKAETRGSEFTNQPPPFSGLNVYAGDRALKQAVALFGGAWAEKRALKLGAAAGDPATQRLAHDANRHTPELRAFDAAGERIDEVDYHPAYHALMRLAFESGVHSLSWTAKRPGAQVARAVLSYLWNQIENGVACPVVMTYAAPPMLALAPEIDDLWGPKVVAEAYDPELRPIAEKRSATIGMALTENQGGSDLRANEAKAQRAKTIGESAYTLRGEKWFCSAPMCDGFVTLAQTENGPTCFFLPRILPDGTRNAFHIQRLKEKCGNRSNASSEVAFEDAVVWRLGEEGRGIATVIGMAQYSRGECAVASAGIMRNALSRALHFCRHRRSFQRTLIDQPLMAQVLAELALESEASMWLAMRMAFAMERASEDEREQHLARVLTPIAKFWICKRTPPFVAEAMECLGGNGYVEEHTLARLYREAPLNGIWEGSGNIIALDVLRVLDRHPESAEAVLSELQPTRGEHDGLDRMITELEQRLSGGKIAETDGRRLVELMAQCLQASLLFRHASEPVAHGFSAVRLSGEGGGVYGSGAVLDNARDLLDRASLAHAA